MKELVKIAIDEEFRPVEGFEDYYISSYGRLWSDKSNKFLQRLKETRGYYRYNLYKDKKMLNFRIHRLVALAFIPNMAPETKTDVNHIDGDKGNNQVSNLEWVTKKENMEHAVATGITDRYANGKKPNTGTRAVYVYKENELIFTFYGINQCSRELGISNRTIIDNSKTGKVCKNGYRFVIERTSDPKETNVA